MLLETSMYARSDDALELDEWIDILEDSPALDAPRNKNNKKDFYFIICLDHTVMIEKEHYLLLLSGK